MHDLQLYHRLGEDPLDADVVGLLEELRVRPLTERTPFFARLLSHRRHTDERVRAAVIAALNGGQGYEAVRAMVSALDDEHAIVREAGVDALIATSFRSPTRIVHALFHREVQVRRRALESSRHAPGVLAVQLLADAELADIVEQKAELLLEEGTAVLAVLDLLAVSLIDDGRARAVLRRAPWGERLVTILEKIPTTIVETDPLAVAPVGLTRGLERMGIDRVDEVVRLLLDDAAFVEDLAEGVRSRALDRESGSRVAWSIVRVIESGVQPSALALAIAAVWIPIVLGWDVLPLDLRKRAATLLSGLSPVPLFDDPLRCLFGTSLCTNGAIDLPVVAGILQLSKHAAIRSINRHGETADWVAAFRRDYTVGVELLASAPMSADVELYRQIVAALLTEPRGGLDLALDIVGAVANIRAELMTLDEAARTDRELPLLMLARARERDEARSLTTKRGRRKRIIAWIAGALDLAQIDSLFLTIANEGFDGDWIDGEVLSAAVRSREPAEIAERVVGFSKEHQLGVLQWIDEAGHFPSGAFYAVVGRLSASENPDVRKLAQQMAEPKAVPDRSAVTEGVIRDLTDEERENIRTCDDDDLDEAVGVAFAEPVRGVASALARRGSSRPSVLASAAVLFSHDDPAAACRVFERYADADPAFLSALDGEMVARGRNGVQIPLLAAAWLSRWDHPFACFQRAVDSHARGVLDLLRDSLDWRSPILIENTWRAVGRVAVMWRMRKRPMFVDAFDLDLGRLVASNVHVLGVHAAKILVEMHIGQVADATMEQLVEVVLERLDQTNTATQDELARWMDVGGAPVESETVEEDPSLEDEAETSTDLDRLAHLAASADPAIARAALTRLESLDEEAGLAALLRRARGSVAFGRMWADALAPRLDDVTLDVVLADEKVSASLRFALAIAKVEEGDLERWPAAALAINADTDERWFRVADFERIEAAGVEPRQIALDLACSRQHPAYTRAIRSLVALGFDDEIAGVLRRFLDLGTGRLGAVRLGAARCLLDQGDPHGLPLVFSAALDRWERNDATHGPPFLRFVPRFAEEVAVAFMAAGVTGNANGLLSEIGQLAHADSIRREAALLAVLLQADSKVTQEAALRALPRTHASLVKLRQLAEIFAWGARESRLLLGTAYRVHLIGGAAYGHTRLEQRSVYVNPMTFLRSQRGGEDVLRGLIVHELGHHVYHAGPEALEIWKNAEHRKRHGLLNLVADEHLERNLRAKRQAHGDHLKVLAAHAFQHADRSIAVVDLVRMLGPKTYAVLVSARLEVARASTKVNVALGQLFLELERSGSSFVRFVRALRMGLGDRHGDPKVQEALALFKGAQFRGSDMPQLWEITQKLNDIFNEDAALIDLMDLHANTADEGVDGTVELPGIDDESVQREVDRILDGSNERGKPMRTINRGTTHDFEEITDIERVDKNPGAHRIGKNRVARAAGRLREVLTRLGLQLEPRRARLRGRTIDRVGLPRALLRKDPRILIAREVVTRSDLFLGVVIDCSGSMSLDDNLEKAKLFGLLLAEACRGLRGVDARFWGFTDTKIFDAGSAERCGVSGLEVAGGNNDAAALWHAAKTASGSRRRAKVLVMISDGAPTECTVEALRALVRKLETKMGFVCAQVAVRELEDACFSHHIDLIDDDLDRAVRRFGQVVSRLVRAALSAA